MGSFFELNAEPFSIPDADDPPTVSAAPVASTRDMWHELQSLNQVLWRHQAVKKTPGKSFRVVRMNGTGSWSVALGPRSLVMRTLLPLA